MRELLLETGFSLDEVELWENLKKQAGDRLDDIKSEYLSRKLDISAATSMAAQALSDMHPYTATLLFVLECVPFMEKEYANRGLPRQMFLDTVTDIHCKIVECRELNGIFGTSVGWWFDRFIFLERLTFGRLQYDIKTHDGERVVFGENVLERGDLVLDCHISSNGRLFEEDCIKSYRQAWEYFAPQLKDGVLPIICWSWLLYPDYLPVFGENSNTGRFARHFHIYRKDPDEKAVTIVLEKVFKVRTVDDVSLLDETTSMQKRFKEYLKTSKSFGNAAGVIFFDGDNILTQR